MGANILVRSDWQEMSLKLGVCSGEDRSLVLEKVLPAASVWGVWVCTDRVSITVATTHHFSICTPNPDVKYLHLTV